MFFVIGGNAWCCPHRPLRGTWRSAANDKPLAKCEYVSWSLSIIIIIDSHASAQINRLGQLRTVKTTPTELCSTRAGQTLNHNVNGPGESIAR